MLLLKTVMLLNEKEVNWIMKKDIQPNYNLFEENLLIRRKQSSSMYQEILTKIEKMQESGKRNDLYMS